MKFRLIIVGLLALFLASSAMANSFNVVFTNLEAGNSVVGHGTLSFADNVGDGSYLINNLGGFSINFTIGSATFTNANIDTNLSNVLVNVYDDGTQFYFDSVGEHYGPMGGSLDFAGDGSYLTTEPNYFGGTPLNLYAAGDGEGGEYFGTYGYGNYSQTPEPACLLMVGSGGLLFTMRRKLR